MKTDKQPPLKDCCKNCKHWGEYYGEYTVSPNAGSVNICYFGHAQGMIWITDEIDWCGSWEEK